MSLSIAMTTALSGMQAAATRTAATANNIANVMTPDYDRLETRLVSAPSGGVIASVAPSGTPFPAGASNVDPAEEMVDLMQAELAFKANASVWETGADMWDVLMSVVKD